MTDFAPGWPCVAALTDAPGVADRLSHPSGDDLLPQVLALTPRGPAWGTDEAGDGRGASPLMRLVWQAIASWAADSYSWDFALALQSLPSEVTWSLPDWEAEYGLPDPCVGDAAPDDAARRAAVRAKHAAQGGQSPAYYVCLAAALGYDICRIDEFRPTRIGDKCGMPMYGAAWAHAWRVHADLVTVSYAGVGISRIGDRLAEWGNPVLECAIRRAAPAHTVVSFAYDCGAWLLDDALTPLSDDDNVFLTAG